MGSNQKNNSKGLQLVNYIKSLDDFEIFTPEGPVYDHMGAILTDAVLQAGMNYKNVVYPRVMKVIEDYPDAITTSSFVEILNSIGTKTVINWKAGNKPLMLDSITRHLLVLKVETVDELRAYLLQPETAEALQEIKGIGPKTVDYLKMLVGIPAIAVDRHIYRFVKKAGIICNGYAETQKVVEAAAMELGLSLSSLDHSIWQYMSN